MTFATNVPLKSAAAFASGGNRSSGRQPRVEYYPGSGFATDIIGPAVFWQSFGCRETCGILFTPAPSHCVQLVLKEIFSSDIASATYGSSQLQAMAILPGD